MKMHGFLGSFAAGLFIAGAAFAADRKAPPEIVAGLPKYCWSQYLDTVPQDDDEYRITGCGGYANHYCPGLVAMASARKTSNLRERNGHLQRAKSEMEYTIRNTSEDCWLQSRAKLYLQSVNMELETLKLQMRVKKR